MALVPPEESFFSNFGMKPHQRGNNIQPYDENHSVEKGMTER
jgi:hypothetical protein